MLEMEKRQLIQSDVSEGEAWLEYIFGICKPDRRVGKLGSRYTRSASHCLPA
jgi:hypothetical protein